MNKQKLPSLIPLLVLTLVTVVMWVGLDIYRAFQKPAEINVPPEISQPLTPTLDVGTINQIENKLILDNSQIPDNVTKPVAGTETNPTPTPEAIPTTIPIESTEAGIAP